MPRYENTKRYTKNNKKYRGTTIYKDIPESDNDTWIITTAGDRLDMLASQFYGNQHLWWYIAKANNLKVMIVPAGTSLRIPPAGSSARGS